MYFDRLSKRVKELDAGVSCYYPPHHPLSHYTDENGWINLLVPGALTEKGKGLNAPYQHIVIDIPRTRAPDDLRARAHPPHCTTEDIDRIHALAHEQLRKEGRCTGN